MFIFLKFTITILTCCAFTFHNKYEQRKTQILFRKRTKNLPESTIKKKNLKENKLNGKKIYKKFFYNIREDWSILNSTSTFCKSLPFKPGPVISNGQTPLTISNLASLSHKHLWGPSQTHERKCTLQWLSYRSNINNLKIYRWSILPFFTWTFHKII